MSDTQAQYDVVIVGGGMVGATMAAALSGHGLKIAVIEAYPFRSDQQPSYDARSIALAYGSHKIFEAIGTWGDIRNGATPIKNIHISDKGQFGVARLSAEQESVEALGYVVENRVIGGALMKFIGHSDDIEMMCPVRLESIDNSQPGFVSATLATEDGSESITTKLLVAADGGNSQVRKFLDIDATRWEYGQTAVIANVTPAYEHNNVAYERFTPSGPMALLPMTDNRCSLVLTVKDEDVEHILSLDDDAFLQILNDRFGFRMGKFIKTSARHSYPLVMLKANEHIRPRVAIIGNAAHTLHPVAGQGFNLGIRDVSVMAEVLVTAKRQGQDIGSDTVLKEYVARRKRDHMGVITFTDSVARVFSNELGPLAHLRSKGLVMTDILPPVKHFLSKRTMGMAGRLPRLSRGMHL